MTRQRQLLRWVGRVLTGIVVVMALAIATVLLIVPQLTGGAALTVLSGSMTPAYPVGSIVIVEPIDAENVQVDDVITFATATSLTTHRVIEVVPDANGDPSFITKGDANRGPDKEPVTVDALRGRVAFHVPLVGRVRDAVSTPWGLGAIALLAALSATWDQTSAFVRRRLARPSTRPATRPAGAAKAPRTEEPAQPEGPRQATIASWPEPADDVSLGAGAAELLASVELAGVTTDLHPTAQVEQQLMLARLNAGAFSRGKVIEIVGLVRGHVVSIGAVHLVVSIAGSPEHLDGVEQLLRPYGLVEAARSDVVHVGGRPTPDSDIPPPTPPAEEPVTSLSSYVLGPPAPLGLALVGAPSNGHTHGSFDQ